MTVSVTTSCKMVDYEGRTTTASLSESTGSKSLTIETGKKFSANDTVQLICDSGQRLQTRLAGTVTSYDSGTGALVVNVTTYNYPYAAIYGSSKTIGTGSWTTVTDPGLGLQVGDVVRAIDDDSAANYMIGSVTAYDNTTGDITINVTSTGGSGSDTGWWLISSGTFATWNVAPQTGDTIDVLTDKVFDIDATPLSWPNVIRALDRGKIRTRNASTTIPLVLTFYSFGQEALRAEKLGTIDIEGGWIEIGTGNNSAGQTFTPPSAIDYPTIVEIETGSGTGVYVKRHVVAGGSLSAWGFVYRYSTTDFGASGELSHVMLFDPDARTLTTREAIPTGAKVRVPNIHITNFQHVTYLTAAIADGVATSALVNWPTVHASTGEAQLENERITWTAKSGQTLTITRGARGTTAAAHAKGKMLRTMPTQGTSGDHIVPRLDLNPSGSAIIKNCSFGWFYLRAENYRSVTMEHVGMMGVCEVLNSPAGCYIYHCNATYTPTRGNIGRFAIASLGGNVDMYSNYAFCDSSQTNQSNTACTVSNCFNIVKYDDQECFVGKRNGSGSGYCFQLSQIGMKVPGTPIKDMLAIGTRINIVNSGDLTFTNFRHGDRTDGVATSSAAVDAVVLTNCLNVKFLAPVKEGASCRNNWMTTDAACKDITVYSANYDLANNGNSAITPSGTRVALINCSFGNARSVNDGANANTVTGDSFQMRNCRFTSPQAYGTANGLTYVGKGNVIDGVTALSTYWLTAGAMVPNYYDCGPFFTLWDDDTAATGMLCVGSFAGEISKDMYDLTGAYLDFGGRLYMETAGDVAVIKSTDPIKSVTSFRNLAWRFELGTNFTVGAAGSGYTSGTEYSVTGGSGTGGIVRLGATTLTTAAVMVSGEGYLPGDVLTVGAGGGQMTLTWMPTFRFRVAKPGEIALASWQTMTTTNLTAALGALSGYDSDVGFDMQVEITQAGTATGAFIVNLRIPTNNDTGYAVNDTTFNLQGPAASDVTTLHLASDNTTLATWTGGGSKGFVGAAYFQQQAYFVRKTAGAVEIMRTQASPITLTVGDNGNINLFAGDEVNLANNTSVESILALVTARLDAAITTRATASDATSIKATVEALPSAAQTSDAVWDEVLTGATHNVPASAGRRLRQLASSIVYEGTAQGPGTGTNRIVLDNGASATDGAYDPAIVSIVAGTGAGQSRVILQYKGSTRTAIVHRAWRTLPDATSEFIITAYADVTSVNEGEAQAGGANTITLNADASSIDGTYVGQLVFLVSGTGEDQCAVVTAYNGTTKVATIETGGGLGWRTVPDSTTAYVMMPTSPVLIAHEDESATKIDELHAIKGLDITRPLTVTPSAMVSGGITVALGGDGTTITTATRAP